MKKPTVDKIDLRTIGKSRSITQPQVDTIFKELQSYGINAQFIDIYTGDIDIQGYDSKGREDYNVVNVKKFLKNIREVDRLKNRVEKLRAKYDIEQYETKELNTLIYEKSNRLEGITGFSSYKETLKKQLRKDEVTGRNKLEEADYNTQKLRKIKYEAFNDAEKLMETADASYDHRKYFKRSGEFKSKKLEREFYKQFAVLVTEQYETYENEFYGWLYDKYGKEFRTTFGAANDNEKSADYNEFMFERLRNIQEAEGSEERYDYSITDIEIENIRSHSKRQSKRRRRK